MTAQRHPPSAFDVVEEIAEMTEDADGDIKEIADANSKQIVELVQIEESMRRLVEEDRTRGCLAD